MHKPVFLLATIRDTVDRITTVGKKFNVRYNANAIGLTNLAIQTPALIAPFGVSKYDNKGQIRFTLDLRIGDVDDEDMRDGWLSIEDRIKRIAFENSAELLGKNVSGDFIDAMFTSSIKENPSGEFPPLLRCTVPHKDGVIDCPIIGEDGKARDANQINRGARVQAIIELARIWTMDKQFGCTPIVRAIRVVTGEGYGGSTYDFIN